MHLRARTPSPSTSWGFIRRRGPSPGPGFRQTMRDFVGADGGAALQHLPTQGLKFVPSDIFLWAAGGSVLLSLGLRMAGRRDDSLFVGEWAPTMVGLGVLARLIGR
jgi:hypothetical protein